MIQGEEIGFAPDNPPPKECIWFTEEGWTKMGTAQIMNIKKRVAQ